MQVTDEMIDRLSHLARLEFKNEEKVEIKNDLTNVLSFVEKLSELNTDGVEPLVYVNEDVNEELVDDVNEEVTEDNKEELLDDVKKEVSEEVKNILLKTDVFFDENDSEEDEDVEYDYEENDDTTEEDEDNSEDD